MITMTCQEEDAEADAEEQAEMAEVIAITWKMVEDKSLIGCV